jgi:hypothetical protein
VSSMDMELRRPLFPKSPFKLILQVGVLNSILVTFTSAAAYALINGAWIERRSITVGIGAAQKIESSLHLSPWALAKAILWLSPLTAITCGWFGLLAGFIGGVFMCLRGPRVTTGRFLIEISLLGLPLACLFPVLDALVNGPGTLLPHGLFLLVVVSGLLCAFICALVFHQRCRLR